MNNLNENNFKVTIPTVQGNQYASQLNSALMQSSHWNKKRYKNMFFLKGGELLQMKRITWVGVTLGVMLIVFIAYTSYSKPTSKAYAQEVAKESYQALSELPEEKRKGIIEVVNEAKNATDLTLLTYDQFAASYPQFTPESTGLTKQQDQYKQGKFLQYTNSRGEKVVLGIGSNDIPFLNLLPDKKDDPSEREKKYAQ